MANGNTAETLNFVPEHSTDSISVGDNPNLCLTDHLEAMEGDIASKAPISHSHGEFLSEEDAVAAFAMANHTHPEYLSEEDAVAAFAMAEHTHTGYAASAHTHDDLVEAIEGLDTGKAAATHTHAQSDVAGLEEKLAEIDEAITALQAGGESGGAPTPMLTLSMHMGKLDNNSGAEVSSSTRICSEPFAVENGKSYWQVNDKGVNMYVLLYDADEVFVGYMGNFASGSEIAVNTEGAAYMRLGSLLGEYDLNNNFYIYDMDPAGGGAVEEEEGFTKEAADLLYAPIAHTHDYAAEDHTHDGFAAAEHTHTADEITGLPSSVDAYSKTEADNRFAPATHTHGEFLTDAEAEDAFAPISHTHTAEEITGLPASVDAYSKTEVNTMMSGKADTGHTHTASQVGAAAASHTHTASSIGAASSSHTHSEYAASNHGHTGYAASDHTHSGYAKTSHGHANYASSTHSHSASDVGALPSSGGTVSGPLTVTGTMISNGVLNTQTIQPKDSGSYSIGSSDNRYYSTYLRVNPNVSSDRRCKRDIATMDVEALAAFVDKLSVVSYNYNDDAADEVKRIGLIAQDVVAADPAIAVGCIEQDAKGFYSLRAADLVFPLIAAVQAQNKRIADLEAKLAGK